MTSPTTTRLTHLLTLFAISLAGIVLVSLALPALADAALANAAGGDQGGGGFRVLVRYFDRLSTYMIPVGAAGAVVGLVIAGCMFIAGNPSAQRLVGQVVVGVVIVLASKGLAA